MSVFSVAPQDGNPVTLEVLDDVCTKLGVTINNSEREDYRKLLAVFHESAEELMSLPDKQPRTDLERFPRNNVHFPDRSSNQFGAWAWKCHIKDVEKNVSGRLYGRSVAIKDNIGVKDVPMLLGSNFVKGYIPKVDATVVTRVLQEGGKILGKATCEALCHSGTSHSASTGPVDNPRAKGYSAGGSSSGCGVLVSIGEVDLAIGADQGGSVRIPSCNCGLVGLKPTYGLIPYTGCGSNEPTNDHLGPMTRTVADNALLLEVLAGSDGIDDRGFAAPSPVPRYSETLKQLKDMAHVNIGIISESLMGSVLDPRVRDTFLRAVDRFRVLGAKVDEVSIPLHKKGPAIWTGISKTGGYLAKSSGSFGRRGYAMGDLDSLMHPLKQESWNEAYVSTKNIYLNGAYALSAFPQLLAKATNLSRNLRAAYDEVLQDYDVLVTPTLPYIATPHAAPGATPLDQIATQVGLTKDTCPFNQTGHPALTLPIGLLEIQQGPLAGTGTKLPVGMQIVSRWWADETVLQVAYAWEQGNDWLKM